MFFNAARLAGQIVIDSKVLEFLFTKSNLTGIPRPDWEHRLLRGFAAHTLLRDNEWPVDVCCDLIDGVSADAARKALTVQGGTLVLVAHVGFLQICFAFVERLFGDSFYLGGRANDPRAALFEGLRSLSGGKTVLIAPDGGFGTRRQSISILDQPTTIGTGVVLGL